MLALQELLEYPNTKTVRHYCKYAEVDIALGHVVASGGSSVVVKTRDYEDKHLRPKPRGILFTAECGLRPYFLPSHVLIKADTQTEIDLAA